MFEQPRTPTRLPVGEGTLPLRATPQISALLAFERAASLMSFSRAATELAVTPSAISHQIRSLEQYFGAQLFLRGGKTISLTDDGETFAEEVRAGLSLLDAASRNLLRRGRSDRDRLRVRVCPDVAHLFLLDALDDFERRNPHLTVSIDVSSGGRRVDPDGPLAVLQIGRAELNHMRLQPIMEIDTVPTGSPALAIGNINDPDELMRHRLIHMRSQPTAWRDWFAQAGSALADGPAIWVDGVAAALQAAEAGLGLALVPWPLATHQGGRERQLVFGHAADPARRQTLMLACRPEQKDDRRVVAFAGWLAEHLGDRSAGRGITA